MKNSSPKMSRIIELLNQIKRAQTQSRREEIAIWITALPARLVVREAAKLVTHRDADWRFIAARILASNRQESPLAHRQKVRLLTQLLSQERNTRVMARAIASLSQYEGANIDALIGRFHTAASATVRRAVAMALDFRRGPRVASCLIKLSQDHDLRVREWAVFNLGQNINIPRARVIPVLRRLLADRSKTVRSQAIKSLMSRKDYESLPWLTDYARRQKVKWHQRLPVIRSLDKQLERVGFDETVRDSIEQLMWNLFEFESRYR